MFVYLVESRNDFGGESNASFGCGGSGAQHERGDTNSSNSPAAWRQLELSGQRRPAELGQIGSCVQGLLQREGTIADRYSRSASEQEPAADRVSLRERRYDAGQQWSYCPGNACGGQLHHCQRCALRLGSISLSPPGRGIGERQAAGYEYPFCPQERRRQAGGRCSTAERGQRQRGPGGAVGTSAEDGGHDGEDDGVDEPGWLATHRSRILDIRGLADRATLHRGSPLVHL